MVAWEGYWARGFEGDARLAAAIVKDSQFEMLDLEGPPGRANGV